MKGAQTWIDSTTATRPGAFLQVLSVTFETACNANLCLQIDISPCRVRPIGSTSESDTEFDRMKQVRLQCFCAIFSESVSTACATLNSERCVVLQEILDEVVRELHRVKDEIINGE